MQKSFGSIQPADGKLTMAHLFVAFGALFIGAAAGLLQTLARTGKFTLPAGLDYYQILTVHGVILGLVLTTFFIIGFLLASQSKTTGGYSPGERKWAWLGFGLMLTGVLITTTYILLQEASVLYTFYAPLMAHPGFYLGLTLVIIGSWLEAFVIFHRHRKWKKENPGKRTPLLSYMSVITMILWVVATIGVSARLEIKKCRSVNSVSSLVPRV